MLLVQVTLHCLLWPDQRSWQWVTFGGSDVGSRTVYAYHKLDLRRSNSGRVNATSYGAGLQSSKLEHSSHPCACEGEGAQGLGCHPHFFKYSSRLLPLLFLIPLGACGHDGATPPPGGRRGSLACHRGLSRPVLVSLKSHFFRDPKEGLRGP